MLLIFLLIFWIAVIPAVVLGLGTVAARRRDLPR
jgi:putative exporter of polyketide antibiotics